MITKENYEELKKRFGHVASWAIWAERNGRATSNVGDMTVLENPDLSKLNTGFVFVGLNASEVENKNINTWFSFHSTSTSAKDYKLRHALQNTPCWGSYITDVIKGVEETRSAKVRTYLRKNPEKLEENLAKFREEMALLGGKPVLIAMGNDSFNILSEHLSNEYTICKITHYSHTISPDDLRNEVLTLIEQCGKA